MTTYEPLDDCAHCRYWNPHGSDPGWGVCSVLTVGDSGAAVFVRSNGACETWVETEASFYCREFVSEE